jgi:hypothetical protein
MTSTDWIGFIGVFILLVAYALSLLNKLSKESIMYLFMNFAGAGLSCFASVLLHFIPFIILEAVWALVSAIGLIKKAF